MLNPSQLRCFVIRPALKSISLWSQASENLVLGTWMVESGLTAIDQGNDLVPGPAYGLGQIELRTYQDLWENFLVYRLSLHNAVLGLTPWHTRPPIEDLYGNLFFCAAMTRVHYFRVPIALPPASDALGMAVYWKTYYNTPKGSGTVERALPFFERACEL